VPFNKLRKTEQCNKQHFGSSTWNRLFVVRSKGNSLQTWVWFIVSSLQWRYDEVTGKSKVPCLAGNGGRLRTMDTAVTWFLLRRSKSGWTSPLE